MYILCCGNLLYCKYDPAGSVGSQKGAVIFMQTGALLKTGAKATERSRTLRRILACRPLYLMMLPAVVWFFVFRYVPIYGLIISFKDYNVGLGITASPWADPWYKYYVQFFFSPYFSRLISNTLIISILKIIFGTIAPVLLALLLNECRHDGIKRVVQTFTYMPHFLSWVIIYGILIAFFSESTGVVNRAIVSMGGKTIPFLTSNQWFRQVVVGSDVWQSAGWGAIIYLASMTGIDPTLYEAARIDGAKRMAMIWHITLPGIKNVIVMLFILRLGSILDAGFDQIYNLYNIQVYQTGDILDTWVFRTGLQQLNFSLATAVGLFKSLIGFVLIVGANKLSKKWGESIW